VLYGIILMGSSSACASSSLRRVREGRPPTGIIREFGKLVANRNFIEKLNLGLAD
jgi:hypothetical protein